LPVNFSLLALFVWQFPRQAVTLNYACPLLRFALALFKRRNIKLDDTWGTDLGKVKTEQIKRVGKELLERFPDKFTSNFDENKKLVTSLTQGTTTRVRNQIAGYITRTIALSESGTEVESPVDDEDE